jgi:hypothetical protein
MQMSGGASFTGTSASYVAVSYPIEIAGPDVALALRAGWVPRLESGIRGPVASRPEWYHVGNQMQASDFSIAALSQSIPLFQLPPRAFIHGIKIKQSIAFGGGAISAYTISVGVAGSNAKYATAFDVFQAPGSRVYQASLNFGSEDALAPTQITATATSVGANLNAATVGTVNIWALLSMEP